MFRGPPIQPIYWQLQAHIRQVGHGQCPAVQHSSSEIETQNCHIHTALPAENNDPNLCHYLQKLISLSSRDYLYANGHKNAENNRYQSADNPRLI